MWSEWRVNVGDIPALRLGPDKNGNLLLYVRSTTNSHGHFGLGKDGETFVSLREGDRRVRPPVLSLDGVTAVARFSGSSMRFGLTALTTGAEWVGGAIKPERRAPNLTTVMARAGTVLIARPGFDLGRLGPGCRAISPAGPSWLTIAFVPDPESHLT